MKSSPGSGPYASVGAGGYTHRLMLPSFPPDVSRSSQSARVFHFDKHGNGHAGVRTRAALCIFPLMPSIKRMFFFFHASPPSLPARSSPAPPEQGMLSDGSPPTGARKSTT